MTNEKQKHEELLQTLATVKIQYRSDRELSDELMDHISHVLKTCKIGDDSEVINGVRHFKFIYFPPDADIIGDLTFGIGCDCKAFFDSKKEQVVLTIEKTGFPGSFWANLLNANATDNKLHEAAKQHYINHYSNAKASLMSEQEANDIFNLNNEN